jgi:hypothetical protein
VTGWLLTLETLFARSARILGGLLRLTHLPYFQIVATNATCCTIGRNRSVERAAISVSDTADLGLVPIRRTAFNSGIRCPIPYFCVDLLRVRHFVRRSGPATTKGRCEHE